MTGKIGITILGVLVASVIISFPLGYAFIADWPGHWIAAAFFGLAAVGFICWMWEEFIAIWRQ